MSDFETDNSVPGCSNEPVKIVDPNSISIKKEVILFGTKITNFNKELLKFKNPSKGDLEELWQHKSSCVQLMEERDTLHLKGLEDPDFTSLLECRIERYEEKLEKILNGLSNLMHQF